MHLLLTRSTTKSTLNKNELGSSHTETGPELAWATILKSLKPCQELLKHDCKMKRWLISATNYTFRISYVYINS